MISKYDANYYIKKINSILKEAHCHGVEIWVAKYQNNFYLEIISPTSGNAKPYGKFKSDGMSDLISETIVNVSDDWKEV